MTAAPASPADIAAYRDLWRAAPADARRRHGVAHREVAGGVCLGCASMSGAPILNHALGVGVRAPAGEAELDEIESFYDGLGAGYSVAVDAAAPRPGRAARAARLLGGARPWMTFRREPPARRRAPRRPERSRTPGPRGAAAFGAIVGRGLRDAARLRRAGWPRSSDRPGWTCPARARRRRARSARPPSSSTATPAGSAWAPPCPEHRGQRRPGRAVRRAAAARGRARPAEASSPRPAPPWATRPRALVPQHAALRLQRGRRCGRTCARPRGPSSSVGLVDQRPLDGLLGQRRGSSAPRPGPRPGPPAGGRRRGGAPRRRRPGASGSSVEATALRAQVRISGSPVDARELGDVLGPPARLHVVGDLRLEVLGVEVEQVGGDRAGRGGGGDRGRRARPRRSPSSAARRRSRARAPAAASSVAARTASARASGVSGLSSAAQGRTISNASRSSARPRAARAQQRRLHRARAAPASGRPRPPPASSAGSAPRDRPRRTAPAPAPRSPGRAPRAGSSAR